MQKIYTKSRLAVKRAGYTIRLYGHVWRIRATHQEALDFLRRLKAAWADMPKNWSM